MILDNLIYNASSVVFNNPNYLTNKVDLRTDFKLCGDHLFWIMLLTDSRIYFSAQVKNYFRRLDNGVTNSTGKLKSMNERIAISKYLYNLFPRSGSLAKRNLNLLYLIINSNILLRDKYYFLLDIKALFHSRFGFVKCLLRSYAVGCYNRLFLKH